MRRILLGMIIAGAAAFPVSASACAAGVTFERAATFTCGYFGTKTGWPFIGGVTGIVIGSQGSQYLHREYHRIFDQDNLIAQLPEVPDYQLTLEYEQDPFVDEPVTDAGRLSNNPTNFYNPSYTVDASSRPGGGGSSFNGFEYHWHLIQQHVR